MLINPDYMMTLFEPQWIWMPAVTVVMVVIGYLLISKIVDIKV